MKKCTICKKEKTSESFNKHSGRKDGLQSHCSECNRERSRAYYQRNTESHKKTIKANREKYKAVLHLYVIEYLQSHPCVDCGFDNILALEFDHIRDKEINISDAICNGWGLDRLKVEIEKCEVRCANCHNIKTHKGCYKDCSMDV